MASTIIKKALTTTERFRKMKVGDSLTIECSDYTAPHGFAKAAGVKVKTERTPKQPAEGYRIKCTRIDPNAPKQKRDPAEQKFKQKLKRCLP